MAIAAVGYTGLVVAGTVQWLNGRALLDVAWNDGAIWVASILTLTAVVLTALRATRPSRQMTR